jgi:hypothetical protein
VLRRRHWSTRTHTHDIVRRVPPPARGVRSEKLELRKSKKPRLASRGFRWKALGLGAGEDFPPVDQCTSAAGRSKKIGAEELTEASMDLVLNRPHSKANELMVGTGEALALAHAHRGFFWRTDEELKDIRTLPNSAPRVLRIGASSVIRKPQPREWLGLSACGRRPAFQHRQFVNIKERVRRE